MSTESEAPPRWGKRVQGHPLVGAMASSRPIKLLLASRNVLRLDMAIMAWNAEPGFIVKAAVQTPEDFRRLYRRGDFDVAIVGAALWWDLVDQHYPELQPSSGKRRVPIVVSGDIPEMEEERALVTGADAYVGAPVHFKDTVEVVRWVARGFRVIPIRFAASLPAQIDTAWLRFQRTYGSSFTRRELEVARLVATGRSDRDIADCLGLSVRTVQSTIYKVLAKLGIESRLQLSVLVWSGTPAAWGSPEVDATPSRRPGRPRTTPISWPSPFNPSSSS